MASSSSQFAPLLRALRTYVDRRWLLTGVVVVGLGAIESMGLVLMVPLLSFVGMPLPEEAGFLGRALQTLRDWGLTSLSGVLLLFLGLALGLTFTKTTLARLNLRIETGFTSHLRKRLHDALAGARWETFLGLRPADLVRVLTSETAQSGHAATIVVQLSASIVQTGVQVVVASLISPLVTGLAVASGCVVVFLIRPLTNRVRRGNRVNYNLRSELAAAVTDQLNGLKLAKSHGAQSRSREEFADLDKQIVDQQVDVAVNRSWAQAGFELGAAAALCGFLWFTAGQRGVQGAELALLALIFLRLASRMMSIQSSLQQLARTLPIFEAYQQLLDTLCHRPEGQSTSAPHPPRPLRQELTLEAVNYRYPGSEVDVLQALDLNLKAGKTIALCGPSGAGKSTLADLCLGMLQPTSGRVLLDQQPLANDSLAGWRQAVAYVPQDVFLFNDTLRRNLTFLAPAASDEELWQALASAAAKDLVKALPQQLDTVVGERGVRLSGGERQRIALARALLRQPSLLVLDEATSSLDSHNERLVRQAIDNLHGTMTILVIAHRLSTIRHADQIAVMQAGRIVQRGAWDELIADTDGPFASMVDAAAI